MSETFVQGVDVSAHQGRISPESWRQAHAAGIRFAWARVADGVAHLDPTVGENIQNAREAGLLAGGYLFFRASRDPEEQAALLLGQAADLDLPPVLDCEAGSQMDLPVELVRQRVKACLDAIDRGAGRVLVYTAIGWWETWMGTSPSPYDLWVAHYGVQRPSIPTAFHRQGWRFWQQSGSATVPGFKGKVDLNVWRGTEDELLRYCGRAC